MKNPAQARWWRKLKADPVRLAAFYAGRQPYLDRRYADPAIAAHRAAYQAAYRAANRERLNAQSSACYARSKAVYLERQRAKRAALTLAQRKALDAAHWQRAKTRQTARERKMAADRAARLRATNPAFAERQRASHRVWLIENREGQRLSAKANRDEVAPSYVAHCLGMAVADVPAPLVALKRAHIHLKRELRNQKQKQ